MLPRFQLEIAPAVLDRARVVGSYATCTGCTVASAKSKQDIDLSHDLLKYWQRLVAHPFILDK
jgi:hypothetical protein